MPGSNRLLCAFIFCTFLTTFLLVDKCHGSEETSSPPTSSRGFMELSTLAGVMKRGASKLLITPEKAKIISEGIKKIVELDELALLFGLGWLAVPVLKYQYEHIDVTGRRKGVVKEFDDTTMNLVFDNVSQLAKLAFVIYVVDVLKIIIVGMGFQLTAAGNELPHAFAKMCYTGWVANRLAALKRYLLAKHTGQDHRDLDGQVQIVDRLLDAAIYGFALYLAVDAIQTNVGPATKGFVAFGSVSTLVVSLAMQGFVAEVFHGLFLAGSNRINEGDNVELLGMKGKIEKLGWLESTLRKSDNILVSIPNKDLAGQRISNLSRVNNSQVKQTLRFKYDDDAFQKLPDLMEDIKEEIAMACPELITDGSRPCRIHMTNYHGDHIEVVCDLHFRVKPIGDNYWNTRQQVLMAIGRAVKRSKLEFSVVQE